MLWAVAGLIAKDREKRFVELPPFLGLCPGFLKLLIWVP